MGMIQGKIHPQEIVDVQTLLEVVFADRLQVVLVDKRLGHVQPYLPASYA